MKTELLLRISGAVMASQIVLANTPAFAQTAADTKPGDIVVTALKRTQNVQDVPAAINAISGETLAATGVNDLKGISQSVPNLFWNEHDGTTMVTIRGIGSTVDSGVTEPTVAMYVDGVFLPKSTMATMRAVDLDRVEVLRGPQGTLYGRNATGGAINFISRAPTDEFEGAVTLGTGSRKEFVANGYISGPLAPGITARLSGGHEEQEGYTDVINTGQHLNGTDANYVRGAVRLEPSNAVTIDLSARYEENKSPNAYQQLFTASPVAGPGQFTTQKDKLVADQPYFGDVDTLVTAGAITWDVSDNIQFKSITSYVDHTSDVAFDADATSVGFYSVSTNAPFHRTSKSYGQEFNLSGDFDKLSWILGTFYFHEKAGNALPITLQAVGAAAFGGLPVGSVLYQDVLSKTESIAAFADATYSFTDQLRLNVGVRYNHEEQNFDQNYNISVPGIGVLVGPLAAAVDDKSNKFLPKVALQFDFNDDVKSYAQWSRGFKSGGINLPGGGAEQLGPVTGPYGSEKVDAYEVGLKTQMMDGAVTANFAGFYYDYTDLQQTITVPPAITLVQNADAKVYGAEAELRWRVTDNFSVDASGTWLHARYEGFSTVDPLNPPTVVDLDGQPLQQAPDFTASLGGAYTIELGNPLLNKLTLRANAFYSDDAVIRYFGAPDDIRDSYVIANASAMLEDEDGKTQLNVFVNNITDKQYKMNITNFGFGYMGSWSPPRTVGVRLTRRF